MVAALQMPQQGPEAAEGLFLFMLFLKRENIFPGSYPTPIGTPSSTH